MTLPKKIPAFNFVVLTLMVAVAICVEATAAREGSSAREQTRDAGRTRQSSSSETDKHETRRLREGTIVSDQSGYFREDGDGASFVADTGLEFGALPNLNLERVLRLLKSSEEPNSIRWSVTGEVTEFSGENFLLISRAVYKSATPPPTPDRITQQ